MLQFELILNSLIDPVAGKRSVLPYSQPYLKVLSIVPPYVTIEICTVLYKCVDLLADRRLQTWQSVVTFHLVSPEDPVFDAGRKAYIATVALPKVYISLLPDQLAIRIMST